MVIPVIELIHLSDLHLHVDTQGNSIDPISRAATVRFAQSFLSGTLGGLVSGFNVHSQPSLDALNRTLERLNAPDSGTRVLVQTGDVSTFGIQVPRATIAPPYPEFDYWGARCQELVQQGPFDGAINLFGNHDIWPGTLPLVHPTQCRVVEGLLRTRPEFSAPYPRQPTIIRQGDLRIEFYELNTVSSGVLANTFALGSLDADHVIRMGLHQYSNPQGSNDPLDELLAIAMDQAQQLKPEERAIRIIAMHHPPHFFAAISPFRDLATGPLRNAKKFGDWLSQARAVHGVAFHLVIAGHRHALDPDVGVTVRPQSGGTPQNPLPSGTVQLVTRSPTQAVATNEPRPAFSQYILSVDDHADTLRVERTVYRHRKKADRVFIPDKPLPVLIDGLPL